MERAGVIAERAVISAEAVGAVAELLFFFFNDTATTEIYTLSLPDALPIARDGDDRGAVGGVLDANGERWVVAIPGDRKSTRLNSSHANLVCGLLLEKKNMYGHRGGPLHLTNTRPSRAGTPVHRGEVADADHLLRSPRRRNHRRTGCFFLLMTRRPPRDTLFPCTAHLR